MAEKNRMPSVKSTLPPADLEDAEASGESQTPAAISSLEKKIRKYTAFVPIAASHFFHNLATSVLILPAEIPFHDMQNTVRGQTPFWDLAWDGSALSFGMQAGIVFNLAVLALGISTAWRKRRITGMIPLLIFLGYAAANALARTSGGRYIVPIDWVILLYFALGIIPLSYWILSLFQKNHAPAEVEGDLPAPPVGSFRNFFKQQAVPIGLLLPAVFVLGLLIPLSETLLPPRYQELDNQSLIAIVEDTPDFQNSGLTGANLQKFMQSENAIALNGRLLYPRFFFHNDGIPKSTRPYLIQEYPRLAFVLIGPQGSESIILPLSSVPKNIVSGMDVIFFGCQELTVTQGLLLLTIDEQEQLYLREPSVPLTCPLPTPECDNNRNCQ